MIANARRILLVRVGDRLRPVKNNIEFPGCLASSRRDTIACVADDMGYALLELEHQQKIPLFPVSSLTAGEEPIPEKGGRSPARSPPPADAGHGRSTSMGNLISPTKDSHQVHAPGSSHLALPELAAGSEGRLESSGSEGLSSGGVRPRARPRASTDALPTRSSPIAGNRQGKKYLKPHILSPFASEFMLTTGTAESEAGVGLFVNLDGDVVRGTVDFESYPEDLARRQFQRSRGWRRSTPREDDGKTIFALLRKVKDDVVERKLELQRVENAFRTCPSSDGCRTASEHIGQPSCWPTPHAEHTRSLFQNLRRATAACAVVS